MTCRRSRCGVLAFAAAALAVAAALAMPMFARSAAAYAAPAGPPTVVYDSAAREFFVRNADGGSLFDTLENLVPAIRRRTPWRCGWRTRARLLRCTCAPRATVLSPT